MAKITRGGKSSLFRKTEKRSGPKFSKYRSGQNKRGGFPAFWPALATRELSAGWAGEAQETRIRNVHTHVHYIPLHMTSSHACCLTLCCSGRSRGQVCTTPGARVRQEGVRLSIHSIPQRSRRAGDLCHGPTWFKACFFF